MVQLDRTLLKRPFQGEVLPLTTTVLLFLGASVVLIAAAYRAPLVFNTYAAFSAVLFFAAGYIALRHGLWRTTFESCYGFVRRPLGAIIFVGYLVLHYFLYGLLLERVLEGYYGSVPSGNSAGVPVFLSTGLVYPESPLGALLSILSNPSVTIYLSPDYGVTLIPFSFFFGFVIAVLVTANIEVVRAAAACPPSRRRRAYLVLPVVGVAAGSSCCLSLPVLVTLLIPAAGAITYTLGASYVAFFLFPLATAYALHLNLEHSREILRRSTGLPPHPAVS